MFSVSSLLILFLPFATLKNPSITEPGSTPVNKALLLQLVNKIRKTGCRCGDVYYPPAAPLTWNNQLEQAAFEHSNDMQANNYFSHAAQDGSKAGERILNAGYRWHSYGENIAMGYRTEKEVISGWIESPGHCENIMNKNYKEMAVARVGDYWTQVFGTK